MYKSKTSGATILSATGTLRHNQYKAKSCDYCAEYVNLPNRVVQYAANEVVEGEHPSKENR